MVVGVDDRFGQCQIGVLEGGRGALHGVSRLARLQLQGVLQERHFLTEFVTHPAP